MASSASSRSSDVAWFQDKAKTSVEFVITRYTGSLLWTNGIEHLSTVYNKGDPFTKGQSTVYTRPNYGRHSETILYHIINRYSNLADTTIFCTDDISDVSLKSYADSSVQVMGAAVHLADGPSFRSSGQTAVNNYTLGQFKYEVLGLPTDFIGERWVPGNCLAVKKERILSKPLSYYQHVYAAVQFDRANDVEEIAYLDRTWYSIFTWPPDILRCKRKFMTFT